MPIDVREAFYLAGLGGVCAGVLGEYGWTWAAMVCGAVLLITAVLSLRKRSD
jgi:hypothetical protein